METLNQEQVLEEVLVDEWYDTEKEKPIFFFIKRCIDIILSLLGLIILSPVFLLIAILIKKEDHGNVFYKHKRIGHMNKDIYIYKFRSMTNKYKTFDEFYQTLSDEQKQEWDENFKLENDPRITKIGNFLRKTSLDELPQIINILKGEMAVIGPRPALWNQNDLITERDKYHANDVRPGLTGWAQINGRDELEIPVKAKLDGEYIEKISFLFDLKCFFGTITSVLKHDGVVEGGTGELHKEEK